MTGEWGLGSVMDSVEVEPMSPRGRWVIDHVAERRIAMAESSVGAIV